MSYLYLMRPFNLVFVLISVYYGAVYQAAITFSYPLLFAMLSAAFIAGGGYAINDVFDYAIDKVNKSERVLPSGKLSLKAAYLYALFLFVMGISLSFFTGKGWNIVIAIINSLLLFYYARKFKMRFLSGNMIVAYTAASTFLYGGITTNNVKPGLIVGFFAFFYTLIREIVKDMEDKSADEAFEASTLPIRIGIDKTILLLLIPIFCIFFYSLWLYVFHFISLLTFFLLIVFVNVPLFYMNFYMKKKPLVPVFKRFSVLMKLDMLALLIILAIG